MIDWKAFKLPPINLWNSPRDRSAENLQARKDNLDADMKHSSR